MSIFLVLLNKNFIKENNLEKEQYFSVTLHRRKYQNYTKLKKF